MDQDWDKDKFPTSARPIFRGLGLLFLLIIGICGVVYLISDHPKEDTTQRDNVISEFSPDDAEE